MRYFTSDTHFGHERIIEFSGRPHASVEHMNADLVSRATALVGAGDELWHLGDVAFGDLDSTLANVARIPAAVALVAGNHDRCHPCNGAGADRYADLYADRCGLAELVTTNTTLVLGNGARVNVSHFPYEDPEGNGLVERHGQLVPDRFAPWRPADDGSWLLCGHVHNSWRQRGRMINVGVDAWGGSPVSEARIIDLIEAGPADRDVLPWPPA